jgi:hypothetical protein
MEDTEVFRVGPMTVRLDFSAEDSHVGLDREA